MDFTKLKIELALFYGVISLFIIVLIASFMLFKHHTKHKLKLSALLTILIIFESACLILAEINYFSLQNTIKATYQASVKTRSVKVDKYVKRNGLYYIKDIYGTIYTFNSDDTNADNRAGDGDVIKINGKTNKVTYIYHYVDKLKLRQIESSLEQRYGMLINIPKLSHGEILNDWIEQHHTFTRKLIIQKKSY